jgi:CRISPR-associated protein Cas2
LLAVICYDCPDDRRRQRLAQALLDLGVRVQKSVFEVEALEGRLGLLLRRLDQIVDVKDDSVRVYVLCEACRERAYVLAGLPVYREPAAIVV